VTVKRQRFLPYAYAERALALRFVDVRVGDEVVDVDATFDAETRQLDLRDYGDERRPVTLTLEVAADPDLWDAVLPEPERADPPVRIGLVAQDEGGWYRATAPTAPAAPAGETTRGTLTVVPLDSTGVLTVEALALRTAHAKGRAPGFAARAGMRLVGSHGLTVRLADPRETPGGSLDIRWEDFRTSNHPARRDHPHRIYYLEATLDPPVLWLNQAIPDLAKVFDSKGTRGRVATTRDLLFQAIALPVWYGLLHAAADAIVEDEDGAPNIPRGWQAGLLKKVAPRMVPGVTSDLAYRQLVEELWELSARGGVAPFVERLVAALQDEMNLDGIARRALKELT